jgi:hypothetical protein
MLKSAQNLTTEHQDCGLQVHFDGMGPTWQQVVDVGLVKYPQATHGILADADFAPMQDRMDKMQLDIRCSKHMFTVWTQDHKNERKMDWIYRNIPGAQVLQHTTWLHNPLNPDSSQLATLIIACCLVCCFCSYFEHHQLPLDAATPTIVITAR